MILKMLRSLEKKRGINVSIRERIRQVRKTLGFTQAVFAQRIAVSSSYFAEMELGKKNVNERTIKMISMEFGIDEHWLRTGEGVMLCDDSNARVAKLNSLFKSLSPRLQDCALNQIGELAAFHNSPDKP
jgi:transcriptional regulator with XRE-family HTH domain